MERGGDEPLRSLLPVSNAEGKHTRSNEKREAAAELYLSRGAGAQKLAPDSEDKRVEEQ